ncbi:bifunctional DNA primase/polymerase [Halosimplex pelagicum]|uniref:Bifunctional DNA primase/polymerase n=1 Tax=Halosimplex pelagicum TaxID=869886 RepID=A0A7D5PEW2_9EURY|nr:bifunctional DNA primase/polymerase [Halosimplex pelagicum]QLH82480.1 bifunctional DNA primase/polymerase [Halosimplex pelagicum]QLH82536.1 bifunctional DNA primase/polymerase [Halosimplex pelagicum]
MSDEVPLEKRVARELKRHPDASPVQLAGALEADPAEVADILDENLPDQVEDLSKDTGDRVRGSGTRSQPDSDDGSRWDTSGDHENPIDVSDVTDEERAGMLREYLEAYVDEFGQVPRLMPLDEEGKGPIIQGKCRLDSPEGRSYLVDGEEAIRQIREEGARGFALYAGKWDHGTDDVVFVDHDEEEFAAPTAEPTLTVTSGSGRADGHETYRNAGDVQNARVGDNLGEIRAENWYVVAPGSVHPTGGIYHVRDKRDIATLADEDLDDSMRPASGRHDRDESESPVQDLDGEGDRPDDDTVDERLERAFANSHDGERIQKVWNGRYRAAGFDDRSAAEFWLANRLDSWVARGDRTVVRRLMNRANLQKWPERPDDSYRGSVLSEVGYQDWYYDPDHYESEGDTAGGGAPGPETCEPPAVDFEEFDREERWEDLQGERYDTFVDAHGPTIWGDHAGAGKTTNAGRAAAARDREFVALFDKHQKAREFVLDDATPAVDFHLKGGAQKLHDTCMDADHADEQCPDHPEGSCPHMCPIYDLAKDEDDRQRYEAVVQELGPVQAHMILDLPDHDADGSCEWLDQFDELESADRVVGVHEYQLLKTVRDGRDVIVDESPSALKTERTVDIEGIARTATALEAIADLQGTPDTLEEFARFARDAMDALAGDETADSLADLTPPDVESDTYFQPVDPEDLPDDVDAADVEQRTIREDVGMPGEGYRTREEFVVERSRTAETFAQAKLSYNETIVSRMRRDEWDGAPLCFDALLAAAAEAGADPGAARQAIAVPTLLESCPWCGEDLVDDNGARVCSDEECDWHEEHQHLTQQGGEQARAIARLDTDDGSPAGLDYYALPLASDLPESPLVLDATATPAKVAALYDVPQDRVVVDGDELLESNMHVTQVLDGQYHAGTIRRALDEDRKLAERIQRTIETVGDLHQQPLFIGPKALLERFDFPDNGETLYYHAARGLNRAECDAVVCIGAPHPAVDDLQRDAELFGQGNHDVRVGGEEYSTRRETAPPVYRKLLYEDDAGDGRAIATKDFSGLVGDLWRETREKELVQAVHRIRPLLADTTKHAYLLTNVPTEIPVDELATFEELADPLEAMLPVPEGAVDLLETVHDAVAGAGPDGFRAGQLVERRDDGTVANKVDGYHRLAQLDGLDVTRRTVYDWVHALEDVGLLQPERYEQHAGVSYAVDPATLKSALSVLSSNGGFKVAATRRLRALLQDPGSGLDWLAWARDVFDLHGDAESGVVPSGGGGSGA